MVLRFFLFFFFLPSLVFTSEGSGFTGAIETESKLKFAGKEHLVKGTFFLQGDFFLLQTQDTHVLIDASQKKQWVMDPKAKIFFTQAFKQDTPNFSDSKKALAQMQSQGWRLESSFREKHLGQLCEKTVWLGGPKSFGGNAKYTLWRAVDLDGLLIEWRFESEAFSNRQRLLKVKKENFAPSVFTLPFGYKETAPSQHQVQMDALVKKFQARFGATP